MQNFLYNLHMHIRQGKEKENKEPTVIYSHIFLILSTCTHDPFTKSMKEVQRLPKILLSILTILYVLSFLNFWSQIPNGIGTILGIVQLALYSYYSSAFGEDSREPLVNSHAWINPLGDLQGERRSSFMPNCFLLYIFEGNS